MRQHNLVAFKYNEQHKRQKTGPGDYLMPMEGLPKKLGELMKLFTHDSAHFFDKKPSKQAVLRVFCRKSRERGFLNCAKKLHLRLIEPVFCLRKLGVPKYAEEQIGIRERIGFT